MNTKASWILLALVVLAATFVPLIPNDAPITCTGTDTSCGTDVAYISVYTKFTQ